MIEELRKHINDSNKNLIEELIYIIETNNLKTRNDMMLFEKEQFKVNGEYLNREESIKYAADITMGTYWDYDGRTLDEINDIGNLKDSLKSNISDDEKINNLIRLYDITGNECLFVVEAYDLIVNNKY